MLANRNDILKLLKQSFVLLALSLFILGCDSIMQTSSIRFIDISSKANANLEWQPRSVDLGNVGNYPGWDNGSSIEKKIYLN